MGIRAGAAGLTETIADIRIIELDTGQINQTVVDKEVATVALTQMADGLGVLEQPTWRCPANGWIESANAAR